jgi:minichromosome maintenance protein 10
MPAAEAKSPERVRLGIDKGLTGRDVSLRRPPSTRSNTSSTPFGAGRQHYPRAGDVPEPPLTSSRAAAAASDAKSSKSFSERLAEVRTVDRQRRDRREEVQQARSKGFGITHEELEASRQAARERFNLDEDPFMAEARRAEPPREFSRAEVLQSYNQPNQRLRKSKTAPNLKAAITDQHTLGSNPASHQAAAEGDAGDISTAEACLFEAFSGMHLSKRVLDHSLLARTFSGKQTYHIPDLLQTIKAPSFEAPDVDDDWVVLGIIASKSSPRDHKEGSTSSSAGRGKYMVFTLTDLKWELELFLFSTAFDRFWKLTPGTVVAILNPGVMPPPPGRRDTGRFSLVLASSDDTVLEIGTARDLGFCKSVRKDGKLCNDWVDKRHTDYCAFHIDASVRKTKAGRMEVNSISAPFGPGGRSGAARGTGSSSAYSRGGGASRESGSGLWQEGPYHDRSVHTQIYVAAAVPGHGPSSARLLDDDDADPDAFVRGYSKQERLRRQLAAQEREREIAKKLGQAGDGLGRAYLRATTQARPNATASSSSSSARALGGWQSPTRPCTSASATSAASSSLPPHPPATAAAATSAESLGLSRSSASQVRLSPLKRKHGAMLDSLSSGASGTGASEPVGWGGAFKPSLPGRERAEEERASSIKKFGVEPRSLLKSPPPPPPPPLRSTPPPLIRTASEADAGVAEANIMAGDDRAKKKTRFMTAKGIREAGRESLGGVDSTGQRALTRAINTMNKRKDAVIPNGNSNSNNSYDDDDDGLDIIR